MPDIVKSYQRVYPRNPEGIVKVDLDKAHSPLKILAHLELLRKFIRGKKIHPLHIRVGITNACNIQCNFCNFHSVNEASFYDAFSYHDKLATEKMIRFLEAFAINGGQAVTFCGAGECTTHLGYDAICRAARKAGLKIGLITNGTLLHKSKIADCIIDTHTWVRIGLNSGHPKSYSKITNSNEETFHNIVNSIRCIRERAAEPDFRIGFNFVVTAGNFSEIVDATQIAYDAYAHYIRFEPEFYTALGHDTIEDVNGTIEKHLATAKEYQTDGFEVSVPKLNRGQMTKTDIIEGDFSRCHYSSFTTALGADGYMYPCPQVHLSSKYRMGKAIDKGYEAWLISGEKEQWFQENPDRRVLCKTCFYRPPNELIEWLLNGKIDLDSVVAEYITDNPQTIHAEFI